MKIAKKCQGCTYYTAVGCAKEEKPYLCKIRDHRGNYKSLADSNIVYIDPTGVTRYFPSEFKKESYLNHCKQSIETLNRIEAKMIKEGYVPELTSLKNEVYTIKYKEVVYGKQNKNNKTAKR